LSASSTKLHHSFGPRSIIPLAHSYPTATGLTPVPLLGLCTCATDEDEEGNGTTLRHRSVKKTGCRRAGLYGDDVALYAVDVAVVVVAVGEKVCEGGIASIWDFGFVVVGGAKEGAGGREVVVVVGLLLEGWVVGVDVPVVVVRLSCCW